MRVTVLTGGVGGAKLVSGLVAAGHAVTAIVNTGDDFRHLGLPISPDIDTLLYTLAGKANAEQGWGRADESWRFMTALAELGGPAWFRLGDGDLALHVLRGARLAAGETLSAVTAGFARAWGVAAAVLPMSDDPVATTLDTDEGTLDFQTYFVARRCEPRVRAIMFRGAAAARPAPGVVAAIGDAEAILLAPSNPWLSIDPMLAVPDIAQALRARKAACVAVSPLIGGRAVKGPTAKLMDERGLVPDNAAIAAHYAGLIDGLLVDPGDDRPDRIAVATADILMRDRADKRRVAEAALALAVRIGR